VTPPSSTTKVHSDPKIREIDALFVEAGLVRSLPRKAAGAAGRTRIERRAQSSLTKTELSPAVPSPRVAPNGVHWLAVPGWEKIDWLWHGFSTRKGGGSRVYRSPEFVAGEGEAEEGSREAPGELNLGFTAEDDRETVAWNRGLFVEAVSGDAATPLVTLRQIHSSVLVLAGAGDAARDRAWTGRAPGSPRRGSSPRGSKGDGLMTDEPGLLLGVETADCIPVLLADRKRRAVSRRARRHQARTLRGKAVQTDLHRPQLRETREGKRHGAAEGAGRIL